MSKNQLADRNKLTHEQRIANPLLIVPPTFRRPLSWLWMCYSHLLPSCLSIAAQLETWRVRHGLSLEEVTSIFHRLTEPDKAASFKFASDLLTELALQVRDTVTRRKSREELARSKAEDAATQSESADVLKKLAEAIER